MPSSTNPKSEHLEARPCSSTPTCVPNHGWCMSINSHAQFCIAVFMSNHAAQMRRLSPHPRPAQTPQLFTALEVEALVEKAHAEERALLRSHLIESSALSGAATQRQRRLAALSARAATVGAVAKLHGIVVRPADVRSGRHSARGASRCDEPRGCARLAATALVRHFGGGGCRGGGGARFRLESRKPHVSCTCGSSESPHSALTRVRPGLVSDHVVCVLVDEFLFANLHDTVFGGELS